MYYPSYLSAYPENKYGRSPLNHDQMETLRDLGLGTNRTAEISFDRPELSPGLKKFPPDSREYRRVLAVLRAGQENLRKQPNPDADGFVPCAEDRRRQAKFDWLQQRELAVRQAIREERKIYDPQVQQL